MPRNKADKDGRCVLAARFSAIGDVAMAVPVLYSLCRSHPALHVVFVTRPRLAQIFVNAPANLTVVGADVDKGYRGLSGLKRLAGELRERYGVTDYVDLHNVLRTRLIGISLKLSHIPVTTLVKDRSGRRALTRSKNKVMSPLTTSRERYAEAFAAAGFPIEEAFDGLFGDSPGGKAPEAMFEALSAPKSEGERWIGIAPFAAHEGKVYPIDLMSRVVDAIAAEPQTRIFLFGGGSTEAAVFERWESRHPGKVTSLAGKRGGFAAELALMSHLDVMLTMDSGNMHLAAIAGTRVLSVWGATHVNCGFAPWHHDGADRIESELSCRPCSVFGKEPCRRGDLLCMRSIDPGEMARRVMQAITPNKKQEKENG